jgi:hypothetical protein
MTLYAQSNLDWVFVSPDGHGGCGSHHARPVVNGAPERLWKLDCPQCEDHLRSSNQWSHTLSEIPETYDEKLARDDFDKRGARDRDQILALAMAKLAGVELPDSLLRPITGNMPHIPIQVALCKSGHQNTPVAKFCTDCGVSMSEGVGRPAPQALTAPPQQAPANGNGHDAPTAGNGRKVRLRDMRLEDLQKLAAEKGLSAEGNRPELIDRIRGVKAAT